MNDTSVIDIAADDEGWLRATSKRHRRPTLSRIARCNVEQRPDGCRHPSGTSDLVADDDLATLNKKVAAIRRQLLHSATDKPFVDDLFGQLNEAFSMMVPDLPSESGDVLCLGLGNPAVDKASLRQLVLLDILIERENRLTRSRTYLYDPVFRSTARALIRQLGMQVITENNEACYPLARDRHHFVFLPHCAPALLNNLLFTNWTYDCISRLVLYANSWPSVRTELAATDEPDSLVSQELAYVCRLEPALLVFPGTLKAFDFEGLRVQCFPVSQLDCLSADTWQPMATASVVSPPLVSGDLRHAIGAVPPKQLARDDRFYADIISQDMVANFIDAFTQDDV